jgi:5-methylcytosine-specific restriction endonuclease McrA
MLEEVGPLQRRCTRCGEVRPLGWYVRKGGGRLRSECRECGRAEKVRRAAVRRARWVEGHERVTGRDIARLGEAQGWRCRGCGGSVRWGYHVDHVEALARGGRHVLDNLQLLCPRCNLRKGAGR